MLGKKDKKFKLLEEISKANLPMGKLFLVKESDKFGEIITPYFYGGEDNYVSDGSAGYERGEEFKGIRVFNNQSNGRYNFNDYPVDNVFNDKYKGLLLPFNEEGVKREYSIE